MRTLILLSFLVIFLLSGACIHQKERRYQAILDPKVGKSTKAVLDKTLGEPVSCANEAAGQWCEYRTASASNDPVPDAYRKTATMGPDLSPYDQFDVLHLHYDSEGVLQAWEPIVVAPR